MAQKIEIFDPPMCCSTGICGPSVDASLLAIQAALMRLKREFPQVEVRRYMLSAEPDAFQANAGVAALLQQQGAEALPATAVDGALVKNGGYPSYDELAAWAAASSAGKSL